MGEYAETTAQGKAVDPGVLTPLAIAEDMVQQARVAVEACQRAGPIVERNKDEFSRIETDVEATQLIAQFYQAKISAAIHFAAYQKYQRPDDREMTLQLLAKSVQQYRELVAKTDKAYKVADDIRNDIPFPFHPPTGFAPLRPESIPRRPHWRDFLPVFEKEYELYSNLLK